MSSKSIHNREISHIIESQMRQWEHSLSEEAKRSRQLHLLEDQDIKINYITISRELGSGGTEVAQQLSKLIHWQVYDKEILSFMAEDMSVRKDVLESVDEKTIGWIEEWIAPIFNRDSVKQLDYYQHLLKVLLIISQHGHAIILGRGAGMVLPRDNGLSIRVVAPLETRVKRYAERENISIDEARKIVSNNDRSQEDFIRQVLNKNICDCQQYYDLVINTEKLNSVSAAKLIWRALDQRSKE